MLRKRPKTIWLTSIISGIIMSSLILSFANASKNELSEKQSHFKQFNFSHHEGVKKKSRHSSTNSSKHSSRKVVIKLIDQRTKSAVKNAYVIIDGVIKKSSKRGLVKFRHKTKRRLTVTVIYKAEPITRLVSFHDIQIPKGRLTLPLTDALPLRKQTSFSMTVPFGGIPDGTMWSTILPKLTTDIIGPRLGIFDGIQIYDDAVQDDGLFSLMMVNFNANGLPFKYGYFLDKSPALLARQYLTLVEPFASPLNNDVLAFSWRKMSDALNFSGPETSCDVSFSPYVGCGFYSPDRGIFSWMNVKRKGIDYSTPGLFLPARSAGANPLMMLPDSEIEFIGHDDPLGMGAGINFSRHRFMRFTEMPDDVIDVNMPELLLGDADQTGSEAISMEYMQGNIQFDWMISAPGSMMVDIDNMDYASLELIWSAKTPNSTYIWQNYFMPVNGENTLELAEIPMHKSLHILPEISEISDVTLKVFGSNGIQDYDDAMHILRSGGKLKNMGDDAFEISRWR